MPLDVESLSIPEVKLIRPARHSDARGFFSETYSRGALAEAGIDFDFVRDNHAVSAEAGTVRGLHFQTFPFTQAKLVRVVRGAILDVAVDIRKGSPTYGRHVSLVISAENWHQILVPVGFAHGLVTLEPGTEVIYKVSAPYAPAHEQGLLWNDPALGIRWPVDPAAAILSEKNRRHPPLDELTASFSYVTEAA